MANGQGRLAYFCWASLGKHSHIPLILLSVGRGLPPSLGPAFPRIQSPCGGSPAWGRNAPLNRWPQSQAVREQSPSSGGEGGGVGGGRCWSHSRGPWGLSPRTPTQRLRLGPAERAQLSGGGQRRQGSCPGGLPGSPDSSFHRALKTLSFLVQDRCCGHQLRCGQTEGCCVGRSPTAAA